MASSNVNYLPKDKFYGVLVDENHSGQNDFSHPSRTTPGDLKEILHQAAIQSLIA
jgi:hypothetical protein